MAECPDCTDGSTPLPDDDVQQPEYAIYRWEYYAEGHANQFLMSAAIDANGNRTDYEYDGNNRLIKVTEPPDEPGGQRAEWNYEYDTAGRMTSVTDPEGNITHHEYDVRNRLVKTTYPDSSTERWFYGTGTDANMLVKSVDRRGVVTNYEYDATGRRIRTVLAAAVMDAGGNENPVSDPSVTTEETCEYLNGTGLRASCTRSGETTEYTYDYRHRVVATTVHPKAAVSLTSHNVYLNNQLFYTEDPYGRRTYRAYSATDGRMIRNIQATVPSVTFADFTEVLNAVRDPDGTPNSTALVTDYFNNAKGELVQTIDPRGISRTKTYDTRGRETERIEAAGTAVAAKTVTMYDANSNVIEVQYARHFDANDPAFGACKTVMTYTSRNKLKTRTEAAGTPEEATESFTYTLTGDRDARTDFRGNQWVTMHPQCCGRQTVTVDPLGHGTITNRDAAGNITHTAVVSDVLSHSSYLNPDDTKTLNETTVKYDERGRVVARTVWLEPLGQVDPNDPPIYEGSPPAPGETTGGLTTTYQYDDNLTDGTGLDAQFAQHLADLNLSPDSDGSATLVTTPAGRRTLSISDGLGRSVRTVQLASDDSALTSNTTAYDTVVAITDYGDVLETAVANAIGYTNRRRTDGAGRTVETVDAENYVTHFSFDSSGNQLALRDPNNVGEDCVFDARNRKVQCADTQEQLESVNRQFVYDAHGNVLQQIDAKGHATAHAYDARDRKTNTTDRLGGVTQFAYDPNGNQVSLTDAENQTTAYEYDTANRKIKVTYPDHVAGTQPGDLDYGIVAFSYDAAGRLKARTDQEGDFVTHVYDLGGRRAAREYRSLGKTGNDPADDTDTFTFDGDADILTAVSQRYSNTLTFAYDDAGRLATESLTIDDHTYTIGRSYDADNRLVQLVYPDGSIVTRSYTPRSQLQQVTYDGNMVASFSYDAGRRETTRTFGNGVVTTRTYRPDNLVATIVASGVTSLSYAYDENGNKTAETIGGVMSPYGFTATFDAEDRLTSWVRDDGSKTQVWNLSPVGDWDSLLENGTVENRTHGSTHELTAIDSLPLAHDAKGNMTLDRDGKTYQWDSENRMISATVVAGANGVEGTHEYRYDALGRRVSKSRPDVTVVYLRMGRKLVSQFVAGTQTPEQNYVYGAYVDDVLLKHGSGGSAYYHKNHQFSIAALTDATGSVAERYTYDAYGAVAVYDAGGSPVSGSAYANCLMFTGREFDEETGLHHFRARQYATSVGRFISRDPLGSVDGVNLYRAYFVPNGADPSGTNTTTTFEPEHVTGHPWFVESLPKNWIGLTRCSFFVSCSCHKRRIWFTICRFPYVSWRDYYEADFEVDLKTHISLDTEKIRRHGENKPGVYGHEQQHVTNCRIKAAQIANTLSSSSSSTRAGCLSSCTRAAGGAEHTFYEWWNSREVTKHLNLESPKGNDYWPWGGGIMPRRSPK